MPKIVDPDLLADSAANDNSTEVYIDTSTKTIKLVVVGDLSNTGVQNENGVTLKALYSFLKEEWRNDPNTKNLAAFPFPMVPITDEAFEFVDGWDLLDDTARYLIRDAGWTVKNTSGAVTQRWAGIIGLGAIETNDQLYFQQISGGSSTNFQLTGQVNQAIQVYRDDDGDGNVAEGSDFDRRTFLSLFVREQDQLYGKASLSDIGVTTLAAQAYRFPISTGTDLDITAADSYVSTAVAISSASWSGGTATINTSAVHGLTTGDYVAITGVTPVGYNVRGTVTVSDTDTFTIAITSDPGAYTSGGSVGTVYSLVKIRYFDQAFTRDVDSATDRNFGIVVDVGTHSGVDGSVTAAGTVLTSTEGGIPTTSTFDYTGGDLVIHEGASAGTYEIASVTATTVTITGGTFPSTVSNVSFTIYPATPVDITAEEIYTAVQYQLRQNADIDATDQSVTGKTADQIMYFVGDTLICGRASTGVQPTNPNSGGSGVIIEGFASSDTNRLTFYDNTNTPRTYPFVATLTISFGANLQSDANAKYFVYFTTLPGASNDFGESGAILVDDNSGADMTGDVAAQASVTLTFNYDNNVQGGRTAGTDADVTVVGIGLVNGQYVRTTATIGRSVSNSASLVAALERNYENP
jgi:hypothetical protein